MDSFTQLLRVEYNTCMDYTNTFDNINKKTELNCLLYYNYSWGSV